MNVSIVIPNYNGKKLLEKNLPEVIKNSAGAQILVVDDASNDDSVNFVKKNFPRVIVIDRKKNEGFSSAVNDGINSAGNNLVMLLNSDVLPKKNYLEPLVKHFDDPKVFAVGSLQHSINNSGKYIQGRGVGRFEKGFLNHGPGKTDKINTLWVFAGAGMYRKDIWRKMGGLLSLYNPFYWEDLDISYRALKAGYKLHFESRSEVLHKHDIGSIKDNYLPHEVRTISFRNQILFVWLNITDNSLMWNHIIYLPFHIITRIFAGDFAFIKGIIKAFLMFADVVRQRRLNKELFKLKDREVLSKFRQ